MIHTAVMKLRENGSLGESFHYLNDQSLLCVAFFFSVLVIFTFCINISVSHYYENNLEETK